MDKESVLDITTTASLYSQIAGVLAGFAFTGLFRYLTHSEASTTREGRREGPIVYVLFATFIALAICAVVYSILAGGAEDSGPALVGVIAYGPVLGLAILAMFHTVVLLVMVVDGKKSELQSTVELGRLLVTVVGPATVMLLVSAGNIYVLGCTPTSCRAEVFSEPFWLGLGMSVLVLVISFIAHKDHPLFRWTRLKFLSGVTGWSRRLALLVLGVSVLSVLATVVLLAFVPGDFKPDGTIVMIILGFAFVIVSLFSVLSALAMSESQHDDQESGESGGDPLGGAAVGQRGGVGAGALDQ